VPLEVLISDAYRDVPDLIYKALKVVTDSNK
jgi:hypothetical protein